MPLIAVRPPKEKFRVQDNPVKKVLTVQGIVKSDDGVTKLRIRRRYKYHLCGYDVAKVKADASRAELIQKYINF